MFSVQKLLGKDEKFYDLLETSSVEARNSVGLLTRYLDSAVKSPSAVEIAQFIQCRRKVKEVTQGISDELAKTFVTPLEREDIDELSLALYRIPKMVEKVVERMIIFPGKLPYDGLLRQVRLLEKSADEVVFMVGQLRGGTQMQKIRESQERLQYAEGEADKVMLELLKELYHGPHEAKTMVILQDLYEMVEKVIDRCRDAGNIIVKVVLKHS